MAGESQLTPQSGPDPTVMTTEQLDRAVDALRTELMAEIRIRDMRLAGMDLATRLLDESVNRAPTMVQREINHLREVVDERDKSLAVRFVERDARALQAAEDRSTAVTAAFSANEKVTDALRLQLFDLKDRVIIIEAIKAGGVIERTEHRETTVDMRAWIALAITILLAALTIATFVIVNTGPSAG